MNFHGVKIALICDSKLLMQLRDNKPGLFSANMWDFPGGGREGEETPMECAIREVHEEFEITLTPEQIIYEKWYPAQKDPTQQAVFMVGNITGADIDGIVLHEGQKWELFDRDRFFSDEQVIAVHKSKMRDYFESK